MDDEEQLLLFGSAAGVIDRVQTQIVRCTDEGAAFRITVTVFTTMRRYPAVIDVYVNDGIPASDALDIVTPILHKMVWCREDTVNHHLRRALDLLVDKGMEVKARRVLVK